MKLTQGQAFRLTKQGVRDLGTSPKKRVIKTIPFNCAHLRMRKGPACEYCAKAGLKWCGMYYCPDCGFDWNAWELKATGNLW